MRNNRPHLDASPDGRASARPRRLFAWMQLAAGVLLVLLFIILFGQLSRFVPGAEHLGQVVESHQLRATAIFYTDFDTSAEAAESIRHSLAYPPRPSTAANFANELPEDKNITRLSH
jgi:hypothetical protein